LRALTQTTATRARRAVKLSDSSGPVTIAIVGAGFCGTLMAVQLMSKPWSQPVHVVLINRGAGGSGPLARGLAYGTNSARHLLNVPAARMSAFDTLPNDFLQYLHSQQVAADGGSFVARHWYGSYLQSHLHAATEAAAQSAGKVRLSVRQQTVVDCVREDDGERYRLTLTSPAGDESLVVDRVVLALGNFMPQHPFYTPDPFWESVNYVRDPWQPAAFVSVPPDQAVLLVGSGLTMVDVAISLSHRHHKNVPAIRMIALSRRGLLPQAHRAHAVTPVFSPIPQQLLQSPRLSMFLRGLRAHMRQITATGGDWRDVLAALRPHTPAIWQRLSERDRKQFLRHLRPFWDNHRHRAAPEIAAEVTQLIDSGQLSVMAGRLLSVTKQNAAVEVEVRERGQERSHRFKVGAVINCTGPSSALAAEPLLAVLAARGEIASDRLQLGLEVAADYRVRNAYGIAHRGLFYVGPLLRARDWEATAVPELRTHVASASEVVWRSIDELGAP
jgi:uncharacterized NAD(P)/FAD-binding protein YdhS